MCKSKRIQHIGNLKGNVKYMVNELSWSRINYVEVLKIDYCPAVYYSLEHWYREQLNIITKKSFTIQQWVRCPYKSSMEVSAVLWIFTHLAFSEGALMSTKNKNSVGNRWECVNCEGLPCNSRRPSYVIETLAS